ncbi:Type 1 glutamine amidotransferase-like domain-containing protein [Rossellomorea aquimaris]|uniref:Type 1 glutamine amidotransferase-like domain-containing protein n=1 Tax=Rossellomorea aquimaris TaxID=189382 RepID=UPI0007D04BDB|nr:peptidase E [Rossellomorea aquimaris]
MKQIIAMGGGGFSMEPDNLLLDQYVINQSEEPTPKVCFIPTASGDAEGYIDRFYEAFNALNCKPSHLSLFKLPTKDLESYLLDADIIYVGGGNTKSMLALWREWEIDQILRKAWEKGIILAGLSAGSICWFEQGMTDSYGEDLDVITGLGFLKGSHSPHYDGEENRRPSYHQCILAGEIKDGYAADDGVALHFHDGNLFKVLSSRMNAMAYKVSNVNKKVLEKAIPTQYLGKSSS